MEEGEVEVGFCTYRIQSAAVEGAELVNELIAEVGTLLVLLCVVEVDLRLSVSAVRAFDSIPTHLHQHA